MASPANLPEPLPREAGYQQLLGVPMDTVERLRTLHAAALDGQLTSARWTARHAELLAGSRLTVDPAQLRGFEDQVTAAATSVTEDFDHFIFLNRLAADLRLLQAPDPDRELRELESPLTTLTGESTRAEIDRRVTALRVMTGRNAAESYEPAARMFKALQVGTLEETYRWLQTALAENPGSSVQDLMTRAAVEVAEAKLELDRYDDLKGRPDDHPAR
jgi:hypothetical protein